MSAHASRLAANLARLQQRMADAALAAGRQPQDIRLIAVTKYVSAPLAAELAHLGCLDLAESRPQQLWQKAAALAADPALSAVRWHLIGHLQRNKVARTLPLTALIHSVDSLRLLTEIDAEAQRQALTSHVLLEVNIAGESAKQGFAPADLPPLGDQLPRLRHVWVCGLMAMASLNSSLDQARAQFDRVRQLRDQLQSQWGPEIPLAELSLGMSGDLEAAIAAGATMVRVGSALTEGCD